MPPAHKITTSQLQCLCTQAQQPLHAPWLSASLTLPAPAHVYYSVTQPRDIGGTGQAGWLGCGMLPGCKCTSGRKRVGKECSNHRKSCWVIGRSLRGNPAARTRPQSQAAAAWWHLSIHDSDSPLLYFHGQRQDAIWQGDCWQGDPELLHHMSLHLSVRSCLPGQGPFLACHITFRIAIVASSFNHLELTTCVPQAKTV